VLPRFPTVGRPEARGIGRETFVDKEQLVVDQTELQLGVGDDDTGALGVRTAMIVNLQAGLPDLMRQIIAEEAAALLPSDGFVVPAAGFGRRGEERLG
jgi:hypothetical protein